jgi:hypothetical protein
MVLKQAHAVRLFGNVILLFMYGEMYILVRGAK